MMRAAVVRVVASSSRASTSAASPCCRKVFVDIPNTFSRSNIQRRGKSIAASVPFDSSSPSKVRKRVPKHERRAMVESFVDKYRAANAGKFPRVSLTQQQTGGSYYVIRDILQELEYKSKFSPLKEVEEFPLQKAEKNTCTYSHARKEPSLAETENSVSVSLESCTNREQSDLVASFNKEIIKDIKVDKAPVSVSKDYESHIISARVEKTCDESFPVNVDDTKGLHDAPSHDCKNLTAGSAEPALSTTNDSVKQILEVASYSSDGPSRVDNDDVPREDGVLSAASTHHLAISSLKDSDVVNLPADAVVSTGSYSQAQSDIKEDMPKSFSGELDGSKDDIDGLNVAEQKDSEEFSRTKDLHGRLEHEEASPEKSTVWGSLKSLAHGIINFWKKI